MNICGDVGRCLCDAHGEGTHSFSPEKERQNRSIWRETKLLYLIISSNSVSVDAVMADYPDIVERLYVKRDRLIGKCK